MEIFDGAPNHNTLNNVHSARRYKMNFEFSFDYMFIAIIPACNLNFHSHTLEFEWLIFGIYIDFVKK